LYLDSFFIGLALNGWYNSSDACLDDIVFAANNRAYINNNITLVAQTPNETWFNIVLNVTGALGGYTSAIPVDCY
jgi:hypothetical protein